MRRIIFDVPRWSIYLHREARGLDSADRNDTARLQFEDELFEKLYAGDAQELPETRKHATLRSWAERVHATCNQLPSFARLQAECRGDAAAAAAAVDTLMKELDPLVTESEQKPEPQRLRRVVFSGCERASAAVEELRDAMRGSSTSHVAACRARGR